jgi:Flp pilus assembly protein TadD
VIRRFSRTAAFGLGALLLASGSIVSAQYAERPADRLSRHLRELAGDPTSLPALIGAGQASLDVGDGHAALGFFARADERSPRNGQVKAGLARAMLMTDKPREALQLFDEARRFGVADVQIAGDRGLAHDLRGEPRRAQQDYVLALSRGANDEVTRRYALSLGITGERDQALKLLDPLLYKRDQAAWRARAFVLAMTGDTRAASAIVHQVMPARMAQTMDQFLVKLAALNPAQKAAAVHLGEMPTNVRFAANTVPTPSFAAPSPTPSARPTVQPREARRRSGAAVPLASPPPQRTTSARRGPTPTPTPAPPPAVQVAQASAAVYDRPAQAPSPAVAPAETSRGDLDAIMREIREAAARPLPTPTATPVRTAQAPRSAPTPKPSPKPTPKAKEEPAKPDPKLKAGAKEPAKADPKAKTAAKKKAEEPKHPARVWVQVAGGANAGALPKEWTAVTAKAPELKAKGPWTAKNRATNRLLAGPFKSAAEAQAAVAKLRKAGIGAFQWSSNDGEAVSKLGGK